MRIIASPPPNFEEVSKLFGVKETDVIFYTYGDTIYTPAGKMPPRDLLVHEGVHAEQQEHNDTVAKLWWQRYMLDADFRISQEAEAYAEQYKFLCRTEKHGKDRNFRFRMLNEFATMLAGPMYGSCISVSDARKVIDDYASGRAIKDIEEHFEDANPAL